MPSVQTLVWLAVSLAGLVWASCVAVDRLVRLAQRFDAPDVLVAVTMVTVGLGGLVSTYRVPPIVVLWDLPFKLIAGVAFLAWVTHNDGRVQRRDGTALVVAYFVYVVGRLLVYPGQ